MNKIEDDNRVRKWWRDFVAKNYFTAFSFGFSYPKMDKFDLNGKKILEIGMGYGREISQFCKLSDKVYGADITPAAVDLTRSKLTELGIENMPTLDHYDGLNLPFGETKFDFVYSCFVVQHMSKENAKTLISNCLNRLTEEGRIFFEFFGHTDFMGGGDKDAWSGSPEEGMYNNAFTAEEVRELIESVGGEIDWLERWPLKEKGLSGTEISFDNLWVCIKKVKS